MSQQCRENRDAVTVVVGVDDAHWLPDAAAAPPTMRSSCHFADALKAALFGLERV